MRIAILTLTLAAAGFSATVASLTTGSVAGSVLDSAGKPIPGTVRVFLSQALPADGVRHPAPPVQTGPQVTSRLVDKAGNFNISALAPGSYVACASTTTPGYLDPCHWATSAPTFSIGAGKPTTGVKVVLANGAVIPIRVNDMSQKLLKPQEGAHDLDFQIHAVTSSGRHHTALISAQDANGRDHSVTVPFGIPITLQVFSPKVAIVESTGKLDAPGGLTITVPAGKSATPVVLNVVGGK